MYETQNDSLCILFLRTAWPPSMVQIHIVSPSPHSPLGTMLGESPIHIGHLTGEPEKCQSFWLVHHPQDFLQLDFQDATPLLGTPILCILLVWIPSSLRGPIWPSQFQSPTQSHQTIVDYFFLMFATLSCSIDFKLLICIYRIWTMLKKGLPELKIFTKYVLNKFDKKEKLCHW